MANPTKYVPGYSYTAYQAQNPTKPLPAPQVDNDFANLKQTTDQTIDALKQVRNSDGSLAHGTVGPEQIKSGDFGSVFDAAAAAAASAAAAEAWASAASDSGWWSNDVTALKADMLFTYALGTLRTVAANDYIQTRREGFVYQVLAAASGGAHIITAGGVKLSVRPSANGWNLRAFGAVGDGVTDDTTAWGFFQAAVGHVKFTPAGSYLVSGTAKVYATGVVGNGVFDDTPAAPSVSFNGDLDTGVYSGGANLIGFSAGGTRRALLGTTTFQIDVQITGTAVQSSATDTTAGRLLPVGAFGLGLVGAGVTLADIDAANRPAGTQVFTTGATGALPAGVTAAGGGKSQLMRGTAIDAFEFLQPNTSDMLYFRREATTKQPWQQIVSLLDSTVADGDMLARISGAWVRLPKGTAGQILRQNDALTAPLWADAQAKTAPQAMSALTAFDWIAIPAWVNRITMLGDKVSLSGSDYLLVQLGVAAGFVGTGYVGGRSVVVGVSTSSVSFTAGFGTGPADPAKSCTFRMTFTRIDTSNTWIADTIGAVINAGAGDGQVFGAGSITLSAALTQVRLTRTGSNTFDAGSASIMWE